MTDKNKVTQAVMDELNEVASQECETYNDLLVNVKLNTKELIFWVYGTDRTRSVTREREQAVIDYVLYHRHNFEVKTPTWVIVSLNADGDDDWHYLLTGDVYSITSWRRKFYHSKNGAIARATRITDPKLKDTLLYANKDFEAIEVEE